MDFNLAALGKKELRNRFLKALADSDTGLIETIWVHHRGKLDNNVSYVHEALRRGTPEALEKLLASGADPNETQLYQESLLVDIRLPALVIAVRLNRPEMTRILLQDSRTHPPEYKYAGQPSALEEAQKLNRTDHLELMELAEARRFMEKFERYKALLEKHRGVIPGLVP